MCDFGEKCTRKVGGSCAYPILDRCDSCADSFSALLKLTPAPALAGKARTWPQLTLLS